MSTDNIVGSKFLGCSMINYTTSIGWSDTGRSKLEVSLVEDDGEAFTYPQGGSYAKFQNDQFVFEGIVQNWEKDNSPNGYPIYNVILEDPHLILQTAQVIVGAYSGPHLPIANLLDVYGYYERFYFNASEINDAGMPFTKIYEGVNALIASGELNFLGARYNLDWSQVAAGIPQFFRIGAGGYVTSLLDIINSVCQVSNREYIVRLVDRTNIQVITRDLASIPRQDFIPQFVAQNPDIVTNWKWGQELANSGPAFNTAGVIFGDVREDLERFDVIKPFWGFNITELQNGAQVGISAAGGINNSAKIYLDGLPIYNVIGQRYYPATILELKCVMSGYDMWTTYLEKFEENKLQQIAPDYLGMYYDVYGKLVGKYKYLRRASSWVNTSSRVAKKLALPRYEADTQVKRMQQVYEYLKGICETYFGRAYAIPIPFNVQGLESETFRLKWAREPSANGGWSDVVPINMDVNTAEFFKNEQGKYNAILVFDKADIDQRYLRSDWCLVSGIGGFDDLGITGPLGGLTSLLNNVVNTQSEYVYVKCEMGTDVFIQDGVPCVLLMMPDVLLQKEDVPGYGKIADILEFFDQASPAKILKDFKKNGLPYNTFKIQTGPIIPKFAYLPLKNNQAVYGPWTFGSPTAGGGVLLEHNQGLTPWNYGSEAILNAVGQSYLFGAFTGQVTLEKGEVTVAGTPTVQLGDQLLGEGPVCTSISCNIGSNGATTTYRFETYTPRFGNLDRYRLQRLSSVGLENAKVSRKILQAQSNGNLRKGGIPLGQAIRHTLKEGNQPLGVRKGL